MPTLLRLELVRCTKRETRSQTRDKIVSKSSTQQYVYLRLLSFTNNKCRFFTMNPCQLPHSWQDFSCSVTRLHDVSFNSPYEMIQKLVSTLRLQLRCLLCRVHDSALTLPLALLLFVVNKAARKMRLTVVVGSSGSGTRHALRCHSLSASPFVDSRISCDVVARQNDVLERYDQVAQMHVRSPIPHAPTVPKGFANPQF
jgi:hypothetical protein